MEQKVIEFLCRAELGFLVTKYFISKHTGYTEDELSPLLIKLRNEGIIELAPCVNAIGKLSGRGYTLTNKMNKIRKMKDLLFCECTDVTICEYCNNNQNEVIT